MSLQCMKLILPGRMVLVMSYLYIYYFNFDENKKYSIINIKRDFTKYFKMYNQITYETNEACIIPSFF